MNETEQETIWGLREKGYAVVVFSPDELPNGIDDAAPLEDSLVEAANHWIDATCEQSGIDPEEFFSRTRGA